MCCRTAYTDAAAIVRLGSPTGHLPYLLYSFHCAASGRPTLAEQIAKPYATILGSRLRVGGVYILYRTLLYSTMRLRLRQAVRTSLERTGASIRHRIQAQDYLLCRIEYEEPTTEQYASPSWERRGFRGLHTRALADGCVVVAAPESGGRGLRFFVRRIDPININLCH